MKAPSFHSLALVLSLAFGSGWAQAQGTASSSGPATHGSSSASAQESPAAHGNGAKLSHGDRKFMEDAAKGGMFEVKSGQLAESKATDAAVKQFAERLVKDHTKANDELKQIAQAKDVQLPDSMSSGERHELSKLGKLKGDAFDREFARNGVKDHEKDVSKFEKATAKLNDAELKAWAEKTLPVLREHLAMAQKLPDSGAKRTAASSRHAPNRHG